MREAILFVVTPVALSALFGGTVLASGGFTLRRPGRSGI
jgi:hypothetical protein